MASITLSWSQLATVVGALQGLLLTGVLFTRRNNRTAHRLLATLMATFTIYLASSVYYAAGIFRIYPQFFGFAYLTPFVFGPLVYLYAVAASDREWRFRAAHLAHFVPVTVVFLLSVPIYLASGAEKIAFFQRWAARGPQPPLAYVDPFKYVSGVAYTVVTVLYLRRHARRIEDSYSNKARVNLVWLVWICGAAALIWAMAVTLRVSNTAAGLRDEHISLGIAILIYTIGYMGLRQPEVFRYETSEFPVQRAPGQPLAGGDAPGVDDTGTPAQYERSGLTDDEARRLHDELRRVMDADAPWKDSDLTLADLAARLHTTPHKLSEVLNAEIGQTFYDFVNGYRVREVQRRIQAGHARTLKMLALALDAGFASKSTFNDAFKKHTNQTPSAFRQALGA